MIAHNSKIIGEGLTYDDVLLVPNYSNVLPREVSIKSKFSRNITLNVPIVSAAMDTVTESSMAIAMAQEGGIGVLHKNMTIEQQAAKVRRVKRAESGMIIDPVTLPTNSTVADAKNAMKEFGIGGIPIVDENNKLIGLVTYKDIIKRKNNPYASKDTLGRLRVGAAVGVTPDLLERVQALVTVGVSLVVGAVLGGWFGNDLIMFPTPLWFLTAINVGGAMIPADRVVYIATAVLLLIANWALLKFTRIGLIIRAGVENRNMVNALGINVRRAFSTVFFLGGFAAGVGGVLVSVYSNGVSPLIAGSYLIYGFIVVVIGGMGSVPGSFLAAMLIGVIRQFANYYVTGLGDFVVVILLAGVLLIRPQGLLGKVRA